ncbi:MAG TPA: helix-turn-helix domain-containing protein [Mycobacteriales bacterium]|jgi:transcriptional regulator with XRE-family HTH domain/tetratricopeptide (TPR) repeat protein|nr:helix-turn-helix domain-containing protein [Mycobacteriales bacterium]
MSDGSAELRRLRRARGLTQTQLADAAGISVRTVGYLERGLHRPYPPTVGLLAAALGVDMSRLAATLGNDQPAAVPPPMVRGRLVGREQDLRRLTQAVETSAVVVVSGAGGVGKTTLCLNWTDAMRERYPDGQLYVDLHGFHPDEAPLATVDALRRLLFALGEDTGVLPEAPEDLSGRYRAATAGRRLLVLLDSATSSAQVRPLLPAGPGATTVVTSRRRLDGLVAVEAAEHLPLDTLGLADAVELLGSTAVPRERRAALAEACGRLPLALVILAAHLRRHPDRVLQWTGDNGRRLDLLEVEDGDRSVRRVIATTVRAVPERLRSAVDLLGLWPWGELDPYGGAALLGTGRTDAVRVLDALVDLHLVEERDADRYAIHGLVAAYLAERAAGLPADVRTAASRRLYRYHLAITARCSAVLDPHRGQVPVDGAEAADLPPLDSPDEVARWFSVAQPQLTAVIRQAQRDRAEPYSWQLPYAADALFRLRGPRARAVEMLEGAVAAVPVGDPFRPRVLVNLGVAYAMSGRLDAARNCWEESLGLVDDIQTVASSTTNIAILDAEMGNREAALRGYERALALRRSTGNLGRVALTLVNLSRLRLVSGDLDGAAVNLTESLELGRRIGDGITIAGSLLELGRVRAAQGNTDVALGLLAAAREQAEANADDHQTAEVHHELAQLLPPGSADADAHLRAAHRLYTRTGDPRGVEVARALTGLPDPDGD